MSGYQRAIEQVSSAEYLSYDPETEVETNHGHGVPALEKALHHLAMTQQVGAVIRREWSFHPNRRPVEYRVPLVRYGRLIGFWVPACASTALERSVIEREALLLVEQGLLPPETLGLQDSGSMAAFLESVNHAHLRVKRLVCGD